MSYFQSKKLFDFNKEWNIPASQILIVNYLSKQSYIKKIVLKKGIRKLKNHQSIYLPFKYKKLLVVWKTS